MIVDGRLVACKYLHDTAAIDRRGNAEVPSHGPARRRAVGNRQIALLGHIGFRIEGGVVRNRLRWKLANERQRQVDFEYVGFKCLEAIEIADLVRADIPILNVVRAELHWGQLRKTEWLT